MGCVKEHVTDDDGVTFPPFSTPYLRLSFKSFFLEETTMRRKRYLTNAELANICDGRPQVRIWVLNEKPQVWRIEDDERKEALTVQECRAGNSKLFRSSRWEVLERASLTPSLG